MTNGVHAQEQIDQLRAETQALREMLQALRRDYVALKARIHTLEGVVTDALTIESPGND